MTEKLDSITIDFEGDYDKYMKDGRPDVTNIVEYTNNFLPCNFSEFKKRDIVSAEKMVGDHKSIIISVKFSGRIS